MDWYSRCYCVRTSGYRIFLNDAVKNDSTTVEFLNQFYISVGLTIYINNFRILHAMNIILLLLKSSLSSGGLDLGLFSRCESVFQQGQSERRTQEGHAIKPS